ALAHAIADVRDDRRHGEALRVLVRTDEDRYSCERAMAGTGAELYRSPYGDIWLRDTGPIFGVGPSGLVAHVFAFNGWGGKYELEGDQEVSGFVASLSQSSTVRSDWILEGGAVEFDGEGTLLTSRSCLLNPNRYGAVDEAQMERRLIDSLGVERVVWVTDGLKNDHTDGHIDTLARFIGPGRVLVMSPNGADDPNREALSRIIDELAGQRDARGRALELVTLPSPGRVESSGVVMPASYVNYYVGNSTVVVPTYGVDPDQDAVECIARCFPSRRVVGRSARTILEGGGAFHCITQQVPKA
ncbi:MAG: agmatine deiminase family protein, partial [Myxococcota bacterium]